MVVRSPPGKEIGLEDPLSQEESHIWDQGIRRLEKSARISQTVPMGSGEKPGLFPQGHWGATAGSEQERGFIL